MPHDDNKRRYQPPPDIIAMLDRGLEAALIELNKPPAGIGKAFAMHFGDEIQRDLRRRLEKQQAKAKEKEKEDNPS